MDSISERSPKRPSVIAKFPNAAPAEDITRPIYFLHIPKTGGTTLHHFIASNFQENSICPAHLWHQLIALDPQRVSQYAFIWGHFYGYLHRFVPEPIRYITLLRNPVDRALSHYAHVMRDAGHYLHARARQLESFSAYIQDAEMMTTVANFQVRSLTLDFDVAAIAATLSPQDLASLKLERLLVTATPSIPDRDALEIAKQRLKQMCFVGITERFEDSVKLLCNRFHWAAPATLQSQNISPERPQSHGLPDADLRLLREFNEQDLLLYDFAVELLEQQTQVHPGR